MSGWREVLRLAASVALFLPAAVVLRAQAPQAEAMPLDSAAPLEGGQASGTAHAADPPTRVVRISVLQGDVSVEPASVNQFAPAELNEVLTSGDRLYTDPGAKAELEAGQIAVRMGGGADLTVTAMTDGLAQFGLASGSIHLRSYAVMPGTVLELDSPEAAITVLQPGDVRFDEDAVGHTTSISVVSGQVQVDVPGISQQLGAGEAVRVHAGDPGTGQPAYAEPLAPGAVDGLDSFSDGRDSVYANGIASSTDYLNAETTGSADLASSGAWETDGDYGPVWFPVVAAGWRPYCDGHWAWVPPWGWTWVGVEPWGFAPYHYGRWVQRDGRWGWLPGTRANKPVYAPAMVAFVGGGQFSASLGYAPGVGVAAWFPLGPREPYAPWYHGSTLYVNRVNASNVYNPNATEARAFFNQHAVNVYGTALPRDRVYANRAVGTVAMPEANFAAGQAVARNQVRLSADQLAQAPLLPHPAVSPERSMVVRGIARVLPLQPERARLVENEGVRRTPDAAESPVYASRPAFVHTQTPPSGAGQSFEQQRRIMDRTEPGRPLPVSPSSAARQSRPVEPAAGREPGSHPAPSSPRSAEPGRAAPQPSSTNPHH